jgi:hypothetical protein
MTVWIVPDDRKPVMTYFSPNNLKSLLRRPAHLEAAVPVANGKNRRSSSH